ncbi:MAG: AarF/ABC1/UbiB kinase family protein [Polyangiales bacterium]
MASMLTAIRDLDRLREIVLVLTRHGFGEVVQRVGLDGLLATKGQPSELRTESLGQRVRFVLQDLGPSFVKLGQIASTRADLLPPEVIAELKLLQDDVRPVPWDDIKAEVEAELGGPWTDFYTRLDERPLASASIAQVHRGKIRDPEGEGELDVAVKVQRPRIQAVVERDVDLLYWFARAVERAMPEARRYSPVDLVTEFDRSIKAELDFVQEAEHAERFAKNFEGDPRVRFPKVYRALSGKRLLTLEFFDGKRLSDAMRDGSVDGRAVAHASVGVVIKMIFEDGFFHADPHPGNIMLLGDPSEPVIGLLDLGLVGHLSGPMRDRALDLMVAAAREDFSAVADALHALGRPTRKVDMNEFRKDVETLGRKYMGRPLGEIELAALVRDLIWGAVKHGIDMPPDFMLVGRSLMTMEGTGRQLCPDLDVLAEAKPYFFRLVARRYSPERLADDFVKTALRMTGMAGQAPEQLSEILEDLRKGHLSFKTTDPSQPMALDRLGRRVYVGLTVASLVLGGALVLASGRLPWVGVAMLALAAWTAAAHVVRDWWRALRR